MKIFSALESQYDKLNTAIRSYVFNTLGLSHSTDLRSSNIFTMILNIIQSLWQNALLYLEDSIQEQNIETATSIRSVNSLARLSGYEPFYGSAANGVVDLLLLPNNNASTSHIIIPNRTRIRHLGSGKIYMLNLPYDSYTFVFGNKYKLVSIPIVQGTFMTARWVAEGNSLESFSVPTNSFYDINFMTVRVNGKKWEQYRSLYDMNGPVDGYVVSQGFDGDFQIVFGNGVHGRTLWPNDNVECEYLTHRGEYGNLVGSQNSHFVFVDSLLNAEGETISGNEVFLIKGNGVISGGMDAESIGQIRKMIGYNSRSCVLANADNYKLFLSRFSFVGYNKVWSETNSMTVKMNVLTNVVENVGSPSNYFNLTPEQFIMTEEQKNLIKHTIENSSQSFAGTVVSFVDPILRNFALLLYIKKDPNYEDDNLRLNITNTLGKYFISLNEDITYIPKSEIINRILDEVDGIVSVDLTIISGSSEDAFKNGTYLMYDKIWDNGSYQTIISEKNWTENTNLCMDVWGNIQLENEFEFPVFLGGFYYYPDKSNKEDRIRLNALNIYFI